MLAADQNCSESQLKLGIIYYSGTGVQKDEEKGLYYLNLSVSQNNEKAISFMKKIEEINIFSSSIKRKKLDSNYSFLDNSRNIQFVINHAKKGETTAQYVLGRYYLSKDIKK